MHGTDSDLDALASRYRLKIIKRMHADTTAVLADPAIVARLEQLGYTVIGSTPEELAAHLKSELDKWGALIKAAGITINE